MLLVVMPFVTSSDALVTSSFWFFLPDHSQVDVTLYLGGFHADTARSWMCGQGDETGQRLVSATRDLVVELDIGVLPTCRLATEILNLVDHPQLNQWTHAKIVYGNLQVEGPYLK